MLIANGINFEYSRVFGLNVTKANKFIRRFCECRSNSNRERSKHKCNGQYWFDSKSFNFSELRVWEVRDYFYFIYAFFSTSYVPGGTALTSAVQSSDQKRIAIARLLIENGADLNIRNKYNNSPLTLAINRGNLFKYDLIQSYKCLAIDFFI